jgi:autotransporter translocation and assembly factor TamB
MRLLKRTLKVTALFCASLLALVLAAVFVLSGTSAGLRRLVDIGGSLVPCELKAGSIEGGLWGSLHMGDVSCRCDAFSVAMRDFYLDWSPEAFFSSSLLQINRLGADGVMLNLPASEGKSSTGSKAVELPVVRLPFIIHLDRLDLKGIVFRQGGSGPVAIESVSGSAVFDRAGLCVSGLDIRMPGVKAGFRGRLKPEGRYPLAVSGEVFLSSDALPEMRLKGSVNGNLDLLHIAVASTGKVAASVEGRIEPEGLSFGVNGTWDRVAWPFEGPEKFVSDRGRFGLSGNMRHFVFDVETVLQGRDVSASGGLSMHDDRFVVDNLLVRGHGKNLVKVAGILGEGLDLEWMVDINDLAWLLPETAGMVKGSGRIRGARNHPHVAGRVDVRHAACEDYRLRWLSADFALAFEPGGQSDISIAARDVVAQGHVMESVSLTLSGTMEDHLLDFSMDAGQDGSIAARFSGGYGWRDRAWEGRALSLSLDSPVFDAWKLVSETSLLFSRESVRFHDLCLANSHAASLCLSADWRAEGRGTAGAVLANLPLKPLVARFLSVEPLELEGVVNADGRVFFDGKDVMGLDGLLRVDEGRLVFMTGSGEVEIPLDRAVVNADIEKGKAGISLDMVSGDDTVHGAFSLPGLDELNSLEKAPVSGGLDVDYAFRDIVAALAPDLEMSDGRAKMHIGLGGTLYKPLFTGEASVSAEDLALPLAGLVVDSAELRVRGEGRGPLAVSGKFSSGNGTLVLDGSFYPDAQRGWPMDVRLGGKDFRVLNVPDIMAVVSPELHFSSANGTARLNGKVTVPEADIRPSTIPEGVRKRNRDIVVVEGDEDEPGQAALRLSSHLTVRLPDRVRFRGFGLDCHVKGELTLDMEPGAPPLASGDLRIVDGMFRALGRDLNIEKGSISYAGGVLDNPVVNFLATRDIRGLTVGILVSGSLRSLSFTGYSTEQGITSQDAITMLLTGKTKNDPDFAEASSRAAAIAGADAVAGVLGRRVGVDEVTVRSSGSDGEDTRVYAGKEITDSLVLGVETGTGEDGTQLVARYRLWKDLRLEIKSGADRSGIGLFYVIRFE